MPPLVTVLLLTRLSTVRAKFKLSTSEAMSLKVFILELIIELLIEICLSFRFTDQSGFPSRAGSMVTDLERKAFRRTAYLQKAEEILEGWVSFRSPSAVASSFFTIFTVRRP